MRGCACRGTAGFAHVSCLAEQAKILVAEAEENNLDWKVQDERWERWYECSLCEQEYHGVVRCALGWACWKTYLGRAETDEVRSMAMSVLGNGLGSAGRHEDALSVGEAELSMRRRLGDSESNMLCTQNNLSNSYAELGRLDQALQMDRDIYSGWLKFNGDEHEETLVAASNYASSLNELKRFEEAKSLMRKTMPVARRVLGVSNENTLKLRWLYGRALYRDDGATLDDLREAVTTLEETERIARRVFGSAHPVTERIEDELRDARAALRAREATPPSA